jgi:hypothetical protein
MVELSPDSHPTSERPSPPVREKKVQNDLSDSMFGFLPTDDQKQNFIIRILSYLNTVHITRFLAVCKKFKFIILQRSTEFKHFDILDQTTTISNIKILKVI